MAQTFNQTELRKRLGEIFPAFKQLMELRGQNGPVIGQRLGFLANPAPEEKETPEWEKMPEDYAGGLEEWQKLPDSEKKRIYEALRAGRKIYVSTWQFPEKRATLDGPISTELKLKKLLGS